MDHTFAAANSPLGRLLLEEITPVVMVLSTPFAEEACQKNGLSFVQMLQPFCSFDNIDVPVRTASDQPYRLQKFRLRMFYASDVRQRNYEAAEDYLKEVVGGASDLSLDLQSDLPQLEDVVGISESEPLPSWFQTFNRELLRSLSFSEHESFDHPVACLLVVSTMDDQPMNKFVDLFNTDQLPFLLNEGAMDPNILKHYLLLHDNQDATSEKPTNILVEMRNTFGLSDCRLLCINSTQGMSIEGSDNPWIHYKNDSSNRDIACFLSIDDLNEIRDFMQDLSSKHIIPHMEHKIRILNQQVSATRKGFKNQIKNLWWRKGREDTPDAPNGLMYTFSSIESQIRVLGDYAFILRDYELALSNYRLISTDYKLDKAWKRYAGAQEMVGLSLFMLDQSRKDSEYCMETAFSTYMKIGSSGLRNATRCGVWWAEMLKARDQHKEAASVYFRIGNEESALHAAVMLEQASYCYLLLNPPMLHKYGFHLILAGNHYYISDQKKHAIRTYRSALCVYKGNTWSYISNHVHFNIGRWYAFLEMFDAAIKHMLEVLACPHQSLTTQELFLNEFLQIVQKMGRKLEAVKLQLPLINISSLKVMFEDHRTYASSTSAHVRESLWQSLEEDMVPSIATIKSNWLESHAKLHAPKKYNDASFCVVGEPIKVYLEFRNPLQISISVSSVSLICELSARSVGTEFDESASAMGVREHVAIKELGGNRELEYDNSSFTLSEIDFLLGGNETITVQLDVMPQKEGLLKIIGVRWTLSDSVIGCCNFDFVQTKKKLRKGRGIGSTSSHNLSFVVVKGLPKLEGYIRHLPKKTHAGDLRLLMLELRNQSEYTLKNIKMKISHPRFLIPGSLADLNSKFPDCLEKQTNSEHKDMQANIVEKSKSLLFSFPNDSTIQGGADFLLPLWLHTGVSGNIDLYISVYYEMENFSSELNYRTLRMHYNLEVLPSLDVSVLITPCLSRLEEFFVRMEIVNRTSSESFWLRQLSSIDHKWEISSLPSYVTVCPSQLLLAGQALLFFFKLKRCSPRQVSGAKSLDGSIFQGRDARLGSQEGNEALFDTARSPLADFHGHERLHHNDLPQGCLDTVDFILISQPVGNDANPEGGEPPRLISHHVCHCSIANKSPIWWLMDGPRTISHDFSASFCKANFHITIHNCSETVASVKIVTFDALPIVSQSSDVSLLSGSHEDRYSSWHDVSLANDMNIISDAQGTRSRKPTLDSATPFVWCASSSTLVELGPMMTVEVPLQICVFAPGTYDLSNYELRWTLQSPDVEGSARDARGLSTGTSRGHPLDLTVLQTDP